MSPNFNVRMRCVVTKMVYVENCTEDQARNDPFEFAADEREIDQEDWSIIDVEEVE